VSGAFRHDDACDCDVLVVGGGLVGLAASMFLAQKGLRGVGQQVKDKETQLWP
jgi:2-polyprenyl-6-methoxyphenol hydroxylase-like FAD-dependent oxidoreductase